MNFKTLVTIGLVGMIGLPVLANITDNKTNITSPVVTETQEVVVERLGRGEATYTTKEGKTETFTYTAGTRYGGFGWSPSFQEGNVVFTVTYSDGIVAIYEFMDRGFRDGSDTRGMVQVHSIFEGSVKDSSIAKFVWDGDTLVVTSKNGAITKLGGFKSRYVVSSNQAKVTFMAARREREAMNNETFDEAISRFSQRVCVRAEGLSYISTNTIINNVMNPMISSGELNMSSSNWRRWNNMNPRLRSENVTNAMIWDCNNVMMLAAENDINSVILWNSVLN